MKLLVDIKDKYTDITDIVNKSILDEGTKNGIVVIGSEQQVGFIESESLESIIDLENNLEWIAPTRLITYLVQVVTQFYLTLQYLQLLNSHSSLNMLAFLPQWIA